MSTLTVAAVQMQLRAETSVESFLEHVEVVVSRASEAGAEVVVLPELASTGLLGIINDHLVTAATVADDYRNVLAAQAGDIVEGLRRMAATYGLVIVGGSHNRVAEDGSLRNTAFVVWPDGRTESQDKIHLTPPEHAMGSLGGDDLMVVKIGPFTVGLLICADIQFPELSRALVERGVDLILCPSLTWNRRGVHRVKVGCLARAMENQLYVVMAPLIGNSGLPVDGPMYAVGRALVTGPVDKISGSNDGIVAQAITDEEEMLIVELDHELLHRSRATPEPPGLGLRRTELYAGLVSTPDLLA